MGVHVSHGNLRAHPSGLLQAAMRCPPTARPAALPAIDNAERKLSRRAGRRSAEQLSCYAVHTASLQPEQRRTEQSRAVQQ